MNDPTDVIPLPHSSNVDGGDELCALTIVVLGTVAESRASCQWINGNDLARGSLTLMRNDLAERHFGAQLWCSTVLLRGALVRNDLAEKHFGAQQFY